MNIKCGHCPLLTEDRECPGQKNNRICVRADPKSDLHTPGILAKILNFGKAVVQHVVKGAPTVTESQMNARMAICHACEYFENGGCLKCGCSLDIKAHWADQTCPLSKWGPILEDQRE